MKLQIPRADALAVGALIASLIAVVQELHWEHPVKLAVTAILGFIAAVVVNPVGTSPPAPAGIPVVPGATAKPEAPPVGEGGQPL